MSDLNSNPNPHPTTQVEQWPQYYRKSNWADKETLTLINAIGMYNGRCVTGLVDVIYEGKRWKWVGDYCYSHGCLRSPIQCRNKWQNLNRNYNTVRGYESRSVKTGTNRKSYWEMDSHERKEINLAINMSFVVYEVLTELLNGKPEGPI